MVSQKSHDVPMHACPCSSASIAQQYPYLEETGVIEVLIRKKDPMVLGKM